MNCPVLPQIKILNRYTGKLIKEIDADSMTGATLTGEDLREADLMYADLMDANLTGADLTGANLTGANLMYADLMGANLTGADLTGANLSYTDLAGANLTNANLTGANLMNANLTNANFTNANLTNADLRSADLMGADLTGAYLFNTIGDRNIIITIQLPYYMPYHTNMTKDFMQIGCRRYTYEEWWNFTDNEIIDMDGERALNFWRKYKEYLQITYKLAFEDKFAC